MPLDRRRQWTLACPVTFEGVGLHSGAKVRMTVRPAAEHSGIRFFRSDRPGSPMIPALAEYVVETTLSTTLGLGDVRVGTVEHLMAALWGMGLTNAEVHVDAAELPVMDGSSLPYVQGFLAAGRVEQRAERRVVALQDKIEVTRGDRSVLYQPSGGHGPEVTCVVDYRHPHAGPQLFEGTVDEPCFVHEIAAARTFCLYSEVEAMRAAGLVKGGSLENAVVIADEGPLSPLRFANECVRHKVLDLVGDLALCGFDWVGSVVAAKAGHPLHVALALEIRRRARVGATLENATHVIHAS